MSRKYSKPTYIFVTGGVLSGLGKGIASASIGKLLNQADLNVVPLKCEGYLNIDPGTMNPIEHGEVFVLEDGEEADMDFGHYERMLNVQCKAQWNITMGKVYQQIFERERRGDFLGKTVQQIPHVTDEIKHRWETIAQHTKADVMLIEVGGTVGDIETELFIEAARQMRMKHRTVFIHLTYVPIPSNLGEPKTKPTQQSVQLLRQKGIVPDIILARCSDYLNDHVKNKIALFCDVSPQHVISAVDVDSIYKVPIVFAKQNLVNILRKYMPIKQKITLAKWQKLVHNIDNPTRNITIGICGKYTDLEDSYASIIEALVHAGAHTKSKVNIEWIDATQCTKGSNALEKIKRLDGLIVPGGFGTRGIEGKINAINTARTSGVPFLGICYGMQLAIIEYARNVCNLPYAHTTEIDEQTVDPVVVILDEQKNIVNKGGTMRKGTQTALLKDQGIIRKLYKNKKVSERHRHRYEVNPLYHEKLQNAGLNICGLSPDGTLAEFIELPPKDHPYFVATQGHPELKSKLEVPAPLFLGLVKAALQK